MVAALVLVVIVMAARQQAEKPERDRSNREGQAQATDETARRELLGQLAADIRQLLEFEAASGAKTSSPAHQALRRMGWTSHLDMSRETRKARRPTARPSSSLTAPAGPAFAAARGDRPGSYYA